MASISAVMMSGYMFNFRFKLTDLYLGFLKEFNQEKILNIKI